MAQRPPDQVGLVALLFRLPEDADRVTGEALVECGFAVGSLALFLRQAWTGSPAGPCARQLGGWWAPAAASDDWDWDGSATVWPIWLGGWTGSPSRPGRP